MDGGRWTVEYGRWAVNGGRWAMDDGRWLDGVRSVVSEILPVYDVWARRSPSGVS